MGEPEAGGGLHTKKLRLLKPAQAGTLLLDAGDLDGLEDLGIVESEEDEA